MQDTNPEMEILVDMSSTSGASNFLSFGTKEQLFVQRLIGRLCRGVAVKITVEPVDLPLQTVDEMHRFTVAGQVVVLARKEDDLAGDAEMLQSPKPLLPLLDGNAEIHIRMKHKSRGLHIFHIFQR